MKLTRIILIIATLGLVGGCGVSRKDHAAIVGQLEQRNQEYTNLEQAKAASEEQLRAEVAYLENAIAAAEAREANLQAELDNANAQVSMYESQTGGLQEALRVTKSDIDELRQQRAAAMRRMREYRDLARRLASMIESGQLSVKVRNSKMVIEMPNAVLFDPGKTDIKEEGRAALAELGEVLKTVEERAFLVAGHTDNVPIKVSGYTSNWELSTARAAAVLHLLQGAGVPPQRLAEAGFGEFDPIATNDTEAGRAQNRRTEIVLMPNISELPQLPDDLFAKR